MAVIPITDTVSASASLTIADDSPLAHAKLSKLLAGTPALLSEWRQPLDKAQISSASLGLTVNLPSALVADAVTLTCKPGINSTLTILRPVDKTVFPDDGFHTAIDIDGTDCWVGLDLDATLATKASGSVDGFGLGVALCSDVRFRSLTRFRALATEFPTLGAAIEQAISNFAVLHSPADILNQKLGTVSVTETNGSVKFSGSYALPISVNALASAELPFNYRLNLVPQATVAIGGAVTLSGSFHVRCFKTSETLVQLALYKKKGTDFAVTFQAGVGLGAELKATDLLPLFLGAILPSVDTKNTGLSDEQRAQINGVLQDSIDRSLAISLNACCSAAVKDEAAVVYAIDLTSGDPQQTHAALASALAGDWTKLAALSNATPLRDVLTHTNAEKHQIAINLLGFYNAESIDTYARTSTVLRDENGRLFLIDKAKASAISTVAAPYLADAERLRKALAEASLASVTYKASNAGAGVSADLTFEQQYFRYNNSLSRQELRDEILLGTALGLIEPGSWDGVLNASANFDHVRVSSSAKYDNDSALAVFFADPARRSCRSDPALSLAARHSLAALIDEADPAGKVRLNALRDDAVWAAMDKCGNVGAFSTLPCLSHLGTTELGAISTDWTDVRWWVDAMLKLGPALADVLSALNNGPALNSKRALLLTALQDVVRHARASFVDGWGLAVMYALARESTQNSPRIAMDIAWGSESHHYEIPAPATTSLTATAHP